MIGQSIAQYRIEAKIGQGGMGVVYRAVDTKLGRAVALKFLPDEAMEPAVRARFIQEAETAARLTHPNICPIHELQEAEGRLFFAMALLEGKALSDVIAGVPMAARRAIDIGAQIAGGLEAAHRQGVVHRDIKSSNIVIDPVSDHASILDFGLALLMDSTRLTAPGSVMGTASYMSPEQANGVEVDHRTDIWSLGVVLYEMCTGRRPFDRGRDIGTLYAIVHEPAPALQDVPEPLARVIEKALAKTPADRWQTAREMATALRALRDVPAAESPTVTMATPAIGAPNNRRQALTLAVAVVTALGAAGLWQRGLFQHAGPAGEKHIALLPFEVIGADESLRPIADGLVDTLTSRLSELEDSQRSLLVVPASEIRNRKITSAEEARRVYGATLVVTGSAQRVGGVTEFHLNLINAVTARQIGSRSFDFDGKNPLTLRKEALLRLLSLLNLRGSGPDAAGETSAPAAYAEYLRGRGFMARYDVAGNLDRAIESFQAATQVDGRYALAQTGLAEACWRKALDSGDKQWAARATAAAETAVRLDGKLAAAHARLGDIYAQSARRDEAIVELRAALQLEPGNADAHRGLAGLYTTMGRFEEAEKAFQQATHFRPTDWTGYLNLGVFYWDQNRYQDAETALQAAATLTPNNDIVHRNLAGLFVTEGKYQQARDAALRALRLKPSARTQSLLGLTYYFQRQFAEAAAALEAAVEMDPAYATGWGNLGSVYRWAPGGEGKARAALGRAVELTQKRLDVTPDDFNARANLAEYRAKLGDSGAALTEARRIPEANRLAYWGRLAIVYELAGNRAEAVRTVKAALENAALPNELRDDPDLEKLLTDPSLGLR